MTSRRLHICFFAALYLCLHCSLLIAQRSNQDSLPATGYHWLSVFGASPSDPQASQNTPALANYTFRQVAHLSIGTPFGVRLRLSNALSTSPITLSDVHVARWAGSASNVTSAIMAGSDVPVTFGQGQTSVTIPAGGEVISDGVAMNLPAQTDLAVSIYVPTSNATAYTQHALANSTIFFAPGDVSGSAVLTNPGSYTSRPFLTSIEIPAVDTDSSIVALGDSITDGYQSTLNGNTRWPDDLGLRLQGEYGDVHGIVNAGISGNGLIDNLNGTNAVARFNRDVIAVPGVKYLVLFEGVNDIAGVPGMTAAQLIAGYRTILARAHEANIYVYGATITPFGGSYDSSAANEALRQQVNSFIRTSGAFDAVIDFDKAVADPSNPTQLLAAYNSGDSLHPNSAGYQAMANSIDLTLFNPNTH